MSSFLPLQLSGLEEGCCHGGPSAQASRKSSMTSPPCRPIHVVHLPRVAPPPMRWTLGCASIFRDRAYRIHPSIVLESVKRDHGEGVRAACETAYTVAVRSIHHLVCAVIPRSSRPLMFQDSGQGKHLCSALTSLPCASVVDGCAPQSARWVGSHPLESPIT
jgi:hypothetical protein